MHQLMLILMKSPKRETMRTTVNLDDALLESAKNLSGLQDRNALLREALTALIQRESAQRLAKLGGSVPELTLPPRRSGEPE
jgi:Arc/MetJ family transcription regulator